MTLFNGRSNITGYITLIQRVKASAIGGRGQKEKKDAEDDEGACYVAI